MNELYLLPPDAREIFFAQAAVALGIPEPIIEKDFWVVWILERLFALEELKTHLTFKGGTSLSKVYRVIDRFSEDVDLSIEKGFFGFEWGDSFEQGVSKNKQRAAIESLRAACSAYVQNKMLVDLRIAVAEKLKTEKGWQLRVDPEDADGQTLLFEYPNISPRGKYIQQSVKIEMGARAEHWPVSEHGIESYVKEALQEKVTESKPIVRVLNVERTFWEKATILHQYAHLPENKNLPPRNSRHYYDFYRLLKSEFKEKAIQQIALLERVAIHKSIYFASGWASYHTARQGTLRLSPPSRITSALQEDYALMANMLFRAIPSWDSILDDIGQFETALNGSPTQ